MRAEQVFVWICFMLPVLTVFAAAAWLSDNFERIAGECEKMRIVIDRVLAVYTVQILAAVTIVLIGAKKPLDKLAQRLTASVTARLQAQEKGGR